MRMRIHPAGRDQKPVGVDLAPRRPLFAADAGDAPAGDGDVAGKGLGAGAVDDRAAADDDIVHGRFPVCVLLCRSGVAPDAVAALAP